MTELEQAQAIKVETIRRKHDAQQTRYDGSKSRVRLVAHEHRRVLLEIVDSQAQAIASARALAELYRDKFCDVSEIYTDQHILKWELSQAENDWCAGDTSNCKEWRELAKKLKGETK